MSRHCVVCAFDLVLKCHSHFNLVYPFPRLSQLLILSSGATQRWSSIEDGRRRVKGLKRELKRIKESFDDGILQPNEDLYKSVVKATVEMDRDVEEEHAQHRSRQIALQNNLTVSEARRQIDAAKQNGVTISTQLRRASLN